MAETFLLNIPSLSNMLAVSHNQWWIPGNRIRATLGLIWTARVVTADHAGQCRMRNCAGGRAAQQPPLCSVLASGREGASWPHGTGKEMNTKHPKFQSNISDSSQNMSFGNVTLIPDINIFIKTNIYEAEEKRSWRIRDCAMSEKKRKHHFIYINTNFLSVHYFSLLTYSLCVHAGSQNNRQSTAAVRTDFWPPLSLTPSNKGSLCYLLCLQV